MATGDIHLQYQTTRGGPIYDVDITQSGVTQMKLYVRKSAPSMLTWVMTGNQFDQPIPSGSYVRVWEEGAAWEGHGFGTGHPGFEGFCRTTPGDVASEVKYTAYDCSQKAASDIDVMSEAWTTNGSGAIITNPVAIPRLVYNVFNWNDDDFAFERGHLGTTGQIIAGILDDALLPLRYYYAAPDADVAYESSDLTDLDYISQKKMVFQSESVRGAVNRMLADNEPAYACQWHPGFRKWRFYNQATSPERTYTLNSPAVDDIVLECQPIKSIEGCYTAVELYGPQTATLSNFVTTDGTLTDISGTGTILQTYTDGTGMHTVYGANAWQITDPTYRIGARILPQYIETPVPIMFFGVTTPSGGGAQWISQSVPTISPVLQASWDGGNTWMTVQNPIWNFQTGTVSLGTGRYLYLYTDNPAVGTTQNYYNPTNVRVIYAPLSDPLQVRYPSTGFEGTAFTEENVIATFRQYHEMLAVGYERGNPVTTADRLAQYQKLAWAIHKQRSKTIWAGGMVIDGLKWDLCRLNRRINIAGVDANGNTVTTGMESMGAVLTDVTYDFAEQTTTLMFSSNALETMGYSVQLLMDQLHIKALARRTLYFTSYQWQFMPMQYSWNGNSGVWAISGASVSAVNQYYDPMQGTPGSVTPSQYGMTSAIKNPQGLPQ